MSDNRNVFFAPRNLGIDTKIINSYFGEIAESKIRAGWNVAFKHVPLACLNELRIDGRSSLLANATGYSRVHIAPEDLPVGLRGTVRDTQDAQFQRRPVSFNVKQLRFNVSIERRISS
ncbi:hypothetical protein DPMN_042985 [Dreissena polymorpha]|uniref:Uncharacterized protein n=1 Tax=Dreissena polymorpha TaxID=45954 RepID=A0A9D4D1I2_DREPO|nr:hypothetical protein DPMN_042985 [Dreissena polymorpha]